MVRTCQVSCVQSEDTQWVMLLTLPLRKGYSLPMQQLFKCNLCEAAIEPAQLLVSTNPFDSSEEITGCPHCKQCTEGFTVLCDVTGCRESVTCGWPSPHGYRQTCGVHWERKHEKE